MEIAHKMWQTAGRKIWKSGFLMVLNFIASGFFDRIGVHRRSSAAEDWGLA
jgi:hypothetical protein